MLKWSKLEEIQQTKSVDDNRGGCVATAVASRVDTGATTSTGRMVRPALALVMA